MSYKNHKDQKLLAEAYGQVQEAAPVGMGSRFGNWAKRKALSIVPFTGGVKSKLEGQKEYNDEVNKLKTDLDRHIGKYNIKKITKGVLGKYLQLNQLYGKTTKELLQPGTQGTNSLTDTQINEFIKSAVTERGEPDNYSQQDQQPQQQNEQLPDMPLERMDPQMKQAWEQYFSQNPRAYYEYTQKFGYSGPAVLPRTFLPPPGAPVS